MTWQDRAERADFMRETAEPLEPRECDECGTTLDLVLVAGVTYCRACDDWYQILVRRYAR
jgi:hypothetical protein